jgi:hypothetical protein
MKSSALLAVSFGALCILRACGSSHNTECGVIPANRLASHFFGEFCRRFASD